jgi:DNA-binding SARP family transcriptional activator
LLDFRVLGPLEIAEAGRPLPLPGAKARAILGILLLHANEVVSADRLMEEIWGADLPETASNTLQVHVSQLRRVLKAAGGVVRTKRPGYLIEVEPDQLDLLRFERLTAEAREAKAANALAEAGALFRKALSLWRGPPLPELAASGFALPELARVEDERLATLAERVEVDLALGRHDELVPELEQLVAEHPLDERLQGQLMLALYRSGRQAEALAVYRKARRDLVEGLGIEPSPALRDLEAAILTQDAALANPVTVAGASAGRETAGRQSRRTVTVLYAELAISTPAGTVLDPETSTPLLSTAADRIATLIAGHGGTAEKTVGDAVVGVFGAPRLHEDDALRAVRAAVEARDALARSSDGHGNGPPLTTQIGVASGEVVATERSLPVSGEPIGRAARLAQAASPGTVVIDSLTRPLVGDAVRLRSAERQPSEAWTVLEVAADATAVERGLDRPMVGREAELRQLRRALDAVGRERKPHCVTVVGDAGIGKSRLMAEFRSAVGGRASVLVGHCPSYGQGLTFWPVREIVAQAVGNDLRGGLRELLSGEPEAELILDRVGGALGDEGAAVATEEIFRALRKLLEVLARRRPLVVVLDDIHWAEATLFDLVEHVLDWSRDAPILLVCLARGELLDERPSWGQGRANANLMPLSPLSQAQSFQLIDRLLGAAAGSEDRRLRLAEAAQGNPLFIEQMLTMLAETGASEGELSVPPTIHALIAARLDRLPLEERVVLEQGSVVGKQFEQSAVWQLLPDEIRSELPRHLGALARRQLVRPADGEALFRFDHELVRDVAYESLPKRTRADLHDRLGSWLEATGEDRLHEYDEIVGYHLEQAHRYRRELDPAGDHSALGARASARLAAAGRRAAAREDMPAAANLLSRAVSLAPREGHARAELLVELGETLRVLGDAGADRMLGAAIEAAAALGDAGLEWRARVVRLRVRIQFDPDATTDELDPVATRATEVLEELGDERGLARAWWVRAWIAWLGCRAAEAEQALVRAIEHARRAGDGRTEFQALNLFVGAALFGPLPVRRAIRRCEEVLARVPSQERVAGAACRALAVLKAMEGRFDEARGFVARDQAILDDLGLRYLRAAAAEGYAMVEFLAGDPAGAERILRSSYETLREMRDTMSLANVAALLAQALYAGGRYAEALRLTEISEEAAGPDDLSAQVLWRGPRAKVLARRGRSRKARDLAGEAAALAAQTDFLNHRADALIDLAEVLRLARRTHEATSAVEEAIVLYERKGNRVSAARARVLLGALRGDPSAERPAAAGSA